MAWVANVFAGLFENVWATAMKQSMGFTKPLPPIIMATTMLLSFGLLAWSMKVLPDGPLFGWQTC